MRKNNTLIFFKLIILVNILFFFNSCNYKKDSNVFFIGGEIINPSSSDVNVYRNNIKIDSIELDNKNTFFKQINNVNSGIYRIEHLPEYQNILVDKGDSIWIRVNGEDFSESLSFTGKGSSKNNFLIDISNYLNNEDDFLSNMYSENSTIFKEIIDSLSLENLEFNQNYQKKLLNQVYYIHMLIDLKDMLYLEVQIGIHLMQKNILIIEITLI